MQDNVKKLKSQLDLLLEEYIHAKTVSNATIILTSLTSLLDMYSIITGEEYISEKELININPYFYEIFCQRESTASNKFVDNFIKNKKFHHDFIKKISSDVVDSYEKSFFIDEDSLYHTYHKEEELLELVYNYYQENYPEGYEIFKQIINDNRLFSLPNELIFDSNVITGTTFFDMKNLSCFVTRTITDGSIYNIGTIVHEIGHVEDMYDISKKGNNSLHNFLSKSSYTEVNALYRERQFYNYLIDNDIYKEEIQGKLMANFECIYDDFMCLLLLSNLPNRYLKNQKYKNIKQNTINKIFGISDDVENCDEELFRELCLYQNIQYGYGNILSLYFLEHPELYETFKENRIDIFNKDLFDKLGVTSERASKILLKNYKV